MQGLHFPLVSPSFCFGLQEQARGGSTFRRKPCSQGLHAVLLNLPGTAPRLGKKQNVLGKNKMCASLWGAHFDKSSAASLAALTASSWLCQSTRLSREAASPATRHSTQPGHETMHITSSSQHTAAGAVGMGTGGKRLSKAMYQVRGGCGNYALPTN